MSSAPAPPALFPKILAPMVRASTLPLRLLALSHGADQVYSEEIIDRSISSTERVINEKLGTVDYVRRKQPSKRQKSKGINPDVVVFRTSPSLEKNSVVFQMGTGDPLLAVAAAKHVEQDVAGIDVNMGCPKKFSLSGGMGAALLGTELACNIVRALKAAVSVPVSAKIRMVGAKEEGEEKLRENTVKFMRELEAAGADSITLHCRTKTDSSHEPAAKERWSAKELNELFSCVAVPVYLNGDIYTQADLEYVKSSTSAAGIMLARPALYDISIFEGGGGDSDEIMREYLRLCDVYDNHFANSKYVVCEFMNMRRHPPAFGLPANKYGKGQTVREVCGTKSLEELCKLWDVECSGGGGGGEGEAGGGGRGKGGGEEKEKEKGVLEKVYSDDYFLKEGDAEGGGGEKEKEGEEDRPKKKAKTVAEEAAQ